MTQDVLEVLTRRRSVRRFAQDSVPREDLLIMADAARMAPSGCNRQRWQFVLIDDAEAIAWFGDYPEMRWLKDAPALALFCLNPDTEYWREDGSAAIENFMVAAAALGYGSCWVQGQIVPYEEELRQRFSIPEDWRILAIVPVGRPAKEPTTPPKKTLDEVTSFNGFAVKAT